VPESQQPMRRRDDWTVQYRDALPVTIHGGYGMFFDQLHTTDRDLTAILCHDCAHDFARDHPWIMDLLRKEMPGKLPKGRKPDTMGHMHPNTNFGRKGHGHL